MLMRFDPFREAEQLLDGTWGGVRTRAAVLPLDAYRRGNEFLVHLDLPGVDPSSVSLTVEKNVLSITAERHSAAGEGDEVLISERPTGTFTRQLYLGEGLATDQVSAGYEDGVLTIRVPVAEEARPRQVSISVAKGAKPQPIDTAAEPVGASA